MKEFLKLDLNADSSIPKYKQIVNGIIDQIESGQLKFGQKIPSINNLSEDYYLSRDTVEKAYIELKERGIVISVKGKGYYINATEPLSKIRVLLLFNKLSAYKKVIYNAIVRSLGDKAYVDLFIHHCEIALFEKAVQEQSVDYHYYLVMPHFKEVTDQELGKTLKLIPSDRLIIMDKAIEDFIPQFGAVYQDFGSDIYNILCENLNLINKYRKLLLVFPSDTDYPYPKEIIFGFKKFCIHHNLPWELMDEISADHQITPGELYITIAETDIANLIKCIRTSKLELGISIGILSYNDTPLKEVLESGITVMTTDFEAMGRTAARMILEKKGSFVKNHFKLILRNSL
ncbi:GntR family transcriptional regulator [Fulvivirgaceae bacterium BMA10]|uniref:GntR family transcriptional regulator n=1 Tax=Splendidivirga corallicola TaxID=3051826 RepID=A0ABT8KHZ5_9BACT|nr:GntR family transcriptional regulator [Fulvivirgaceae bacterium BMA10]